MKCRDYTKHIERELSDGGRRGGGVDGEVEGGGGGNSVLNVMGVVRMRCGRWWGGCKGRLFNVACRV